MWQSEVRAGAFQITDPEMLKKLTAMNISVIDLSDVKSSDKLNHSTFASSPAIVQMIGTRLAADDIQTRKASLSDKVGILAGAVSKTVGSAAELAVELPSNVVGGVTDGVSSVGAATPAR